MKRIVKIIMRREDLTEEEATRWVKEVLTEVKEMIMNGQTLEAEDYFESELSLEPDYLLNALI